MLAAAAYFSCAEALTNVARYSGAAAASIRLAVASDMLSLWVTDDGRGGADPATGTGLRGLADRAEALGGSLTIDSPPGRGTTITLRLPLAENARRIDSLSLPCGTCSRDARDTAMTRMSRLGWLSAAVLAAAALGLWTARVVLTEPGFALAGSGRIGLAVLLLPGWSLIGVGLVSWWHRQETRAAMWFAAAGAAWFLAEWNNPAVASSIAFTVGLVLYAAAPPLVAHGVLSYPTGRISRPESVLLAAGYVVTLVGMGLLPALLVDPTDAGCQTCPRNLVALVDAPDLARTVTRRG